MPRGKAMARTFEGCANIFSDNAQQENIKVGCRAELSVFVACSFTHEDSEHA